MKTPRLVAIESDYSQQIKKKARYERKRALARDLPYGQLSFDAERLREFMDLWRRQRVGGRFPVWGRYSVGRFEREGWRLYGNDLGLHPIIVCGRYAYAGPPLYDKAERPWLAKFLWFSVIDALVGEVDWLDLGGGSGRQTWRELLMHRDRSYKWQYVQRRFKDAPELQPPWHAQVCGCGWRQLVIGGEPCRGC